MSRFIRYTTHAICPAIIDPGTIRAFLPSPHGNNFTTLVLDGGTKVHVNNGGPDETFRDANPGAESPLPGLVRLDTAAESATHQHVTAFADVMEGRLSQNRHKGDRLGWLNETFATHVEQAMKHLKELEALFLHGEMHQHDVDRLTADCANRLMMARDRFANPPK